MSDYKELIPEIRFKGYTDPWVERKLGEVAEFSKGSGYSKADLNDSGIPIILYGRLYTNYETVIHHVNTYAGVNEQSVISKGGEVIVPSSGETAEDISRASVVGEQGIILGGDLNIIMANSAISPIFLAITISNGKQQKELSKRAQGKSIVHLNNSDLKEVMLKIPQTIEQTAIGDFFRLLDNTIVKRQQQLDKLKELKKGYLQQMFPQAGEKVPRVRFKGFSGEWRAGKIEELFTERKERSANGELISVTINWGIVKANELERKDNSSEDKSNYKKVEIGDIAYNSMRMWQGASGFSNYSGILSPAYTVITPKCGINSLFFSYMFKLPKMIEIFQASSQGLTSDTWNLKFPLLKEILVKFPSSDEQAAISKFFSVIDIQISILSVGIEQLKTLKKAYLKKMFI